MRRLAGQAGQALIRTLERIGMMLLTLLLLALLGMGALAYRLSQGPLEIPWAANRLANVVSGDDVRIHIGDAALAWAGFKQGSGTPIVLRLADVTARNPGGALLASVPSANLVFSLPALFAGKAPIFVSSMDARIWGAALPVSLLAAIRLKPGFALARADLWITLGAGRLGPPGMDEPLRDGAFLLRITPQEVRLEDGTLRLQPIGQSAPTVHFAAAADKKDLWRGMITLSLATLGAADVVRYWPSGLGPATRRWVARNVIGGTVRDAAFTLVVSAPSHLSDLNLDQVTGGFRGEDLTLTWLPGVQPLTGLNGTLSFTDLDDVEIAADRAQWGGVAVTAGRMQITGVSQQNQFATLVLPISGTLQDTLTALNGPNLQLLQGVPKPVLSASGSMAGKVSVTLPLLADLALRDVNMTVATTLSDVTLPLPMQGLALRRGEMDVNATLQNLVIKGDGELSQQPARYTAQVQFPREGNADTQIAVDLESTATPESLREIGWDAGGLVQGDLPVKLHLSAKGNDGSVSIAFDLHQASLKLPVFGWRKPAGVPGSCQIVARFNGDRFDGISRIDRLTAQAPGLDLTTRLEGDAIAFDHAQLGNTIGSGLVVPPQAQGQPWRITLAGNVLDLSALVSPDKSQVAEPTQGSGPKAAGTGKLTGVPWIATARFTRLILAPPPEPALTDFTFQGSGRTGFLLSAAANALVAPGKPVSLRIVPAPGKPEGSLETMTLQTNAGGDLLRVVGALNNLRNGKLDLSASYGVASPMAGRVEMTDFRLLNAPPAGKFLQAVSVFGIPEAASGPGLLFFRLVAPFTIDDQIVTLKGARAYSASLGVTASGTIDLAKNMYDLGGTVVPAYLLNALPGKIPLIGKLFSPEKGGGLFAMRFTMTGPFSDPAVSVNPFSALTPGFLREIFGSGSPPPAQSSAR